MKAKLVDLEKLSEINKIRTGQMFQVQSTRHGNWKGRAVRTARGSLMFERPLDNCKILVAIFDIDTLIFLDPIG